MKNLHLPIIFVTLNQDNNKSRFMVHVMPVVQHDIMSKAVIFLWNTRKCRVILNLRQEPLLKSVTIFKGNINLRKINL